MGILNTIKIPNHEVKCNICPPTSPTTYKCTFTITPEVIHHLQEHQVNKDKAEQLQTWLSGYFFSISSVQWLKLTCKSCYSTFEDINSFNLMKHLIEADKENPPLECIPNG